MLAVKASLMLSARCRGTPLVWAGGERTLSQQHSNVREAITYRLRYPPCMKQGVDSRIRGHSKGPIRLNYDSLSSAVDSNRNIEVPFRAVREIEHRKCHAV